MVTKEGGWGQKDNSVLDIKRAKLQVKNRRHVVSALTTMRDGPSWLLVLWHGPACRSPCLGLLAAIQRLGSCSISHRIRNFQPFEIAIATKLNRWGPKVVSLDCVGFSRLSKARIWAAKQAQASKPSNTQPDHASDPIDSLPSMHCVLDWS
jgi:hypothetical protein